VIVEQICIANQSQLVDGMSLQCAWGFSIVGGEMFPVVSESPLILIKFDSCMPLSIVPAGCEVDVVLRNVDEDVRFNAVLVGSLWCGGLNGKLEPVVIEGVSLRHDCSVRLRFVSSVETKVTGLRLEMLQRSVFT